MGLNPFRDSNLEILQTGIEDFLKDHFGFIVESARENWGLFLKKGRERITIMFIPHSEKRIINFHVPIFTISIIVLTLITTITITSLAIINHSSTIKDVIKLKRYGINSNIQKKQYSEELNRLYNLFQKLKPEIAGLYKLTSKNIDSQLWAKGGGQPPNGAYVIENGDSPPIEVLNIQEMQQELKTTKEALEEIKAFLQERKKIMENTPSIWPVDGYIFTKYGMTTSPYTFQREFNSGIEIASFPGKQIKATASGKVEKITWDSKYGLRITIRHKYGFSTCYSHCERVIADENQQVSKGDVIAYLGKTGKASRHMCLYQVMIGTECVDPYPYLNTIVQ
jgi:murein DD-endopeptidase MepM/ murein hydrolase activator NlpD